MSLTLRRFFGTAAAIIAADQATKAIILARFEAHDSVTVIDGFLKIVHVRNPGAAFSLLAGASEAFRAPFFIVVTIAAIVVLTSIAWRLDPRERWLATALGGVLGGAVGNLIDRLRFGEVVDFVYVHWGDWVWPAFNVADSSISISVIGIVLHSLLSQDSHASSRSSDGAPA
ncbi:MAG: signal peptidase II [Candidatus Binatia bacterium]